MSRGPRNEEACVVPSNASPLIGTDRILRDTSGNTGFIYTVRERQSDFDIPTGPKHHARNHVQQYMREGRGSSAYGRNDVGFHRPGFLHSHESIYCPRLDAQGNPPNNFQRTYGALTADEIPRYREYRQRTRKDIGQDGQPVWPDALEEAFQIAIRDIPPVLGKKKLQVRGPDGSMKLCGRNELLSKKIFQLTGILRTRKQISSHIQVIRGFLRKGNNMTRYVSTDPKMVENFNSKTIRYSEEEGKLVFTDPNASARTSNIKVERPKIGDSYPSSIPNMRISNNKLTTVHGVEFSMHIYPPTGSLDERGKPTHMFTTVQSNVGAQTKMLGDVESWRTFFPELEKLIEGEKNMKCDVVLMEVNLALMDSQPPPHSFVGILHDVVIGCSTILNDSQWQARTTFYENRGHRVGQLLKTLKVQILEQSRIKLHDIPLESQFFVTRFSETLEGRRQIKKEEQKSQQDQGHSNWHNEIARLLEEEERRSRRLFNDISIMQELFVIGPKGSTERVAIFLWRFRKTHSGETATTTWRKLIPPISDSGFPLQSLTQQLSIPTPSTSRTNHYDPLDTDLTPTTAGSTLSNTDQSLMAWEGHEWDNGIQQDPRSSHDLGINFQNDCFSTQGSYYPDPPELQQNTSSMTYANDGQVDSAFDSQVTPFPSQASIDHAIQANADNSLPSELLSRRIQEFADQTNSDVVNHDLTGKSTYEDDSQRHIEDMEFNSQDTTGFLQSHSEDYSFHNVNDPHLFTDFNGGHIHLDFNHEQTTGPHSLESLHVQANFQHSQDIGFPHSPHQNQLPSTFGTPELLGTTAQSSTPILATTHANDVGENQASPELCADAHTINRHHDPDICADGDLLIHLAKVSREQELQHQRRQQLSQASQPPTHDLHTDSTHVDMNLQTQQLLVRIETEVVKSHITTFATTTVPTVPSNVSASTSPSLGAVNLNSIFDASSSTTHHPILQNFAERGTWSIPGMGTLPDGLFEDVGANSHSGSVGVEVARAMTGAFVDTTPTAGRLSTGEESEHGRVIGEIEGEESECEGDQVEEEGVDVRCEEARMDMELDGV